MALRNAGDFYELFGSDVSSRRHLIWMWHLLDRPVGTLSQGAFGPGMRDYLADCVRKSPNLKWYIQSNLGLMLLPDEKLRWIGDSERQNEFVYGEFSRLLSFAVPQVHHSLVNRERTIAVIDASVYDVNLKSSTLEKIEAAWAVHIFSDRYFRWFGSCNEGERCRFLWEWLVKNRPGYVAFKAPFSDLEAALLLFDRKCVSAAERELISDKVKRAFSQRKFRENQTDKKQCNLVLQEKSIKSLDKMAKKYDLSRAEIIEILIQDESVRGTYISARLERHRNLVQGDQATQPNGRFSV